MVVSGASRSILPDVQMWRILTIHAHWSVLDSSNDCWHTGMTLGKVCSRSEHVSIFSVLYILEKHENLLKKVITDSIRELDNLSRHV